MLERKKNCATLTEDFVNCKALIIDQSLLINQSKKFFELHNSAVELSENDNAMNSEDEREDARKRVEATANTHNKEKNFTNL